MTADLAVTVYTFRASFASHHGSEEKTELLVDFRSLSGSQ